MRTPDPRIAVALAAAALIATNAAPAAAVPAPIAGILLAGAPDDGATAAVDVSPLGVVVGTSGTAEPYPGDPADDARPYRWLPRLDGTFHAQVLAVPDGTTRGVVRGVSDLGVVGGTAYTATTATAVRWSLDGRTATPIGPANSSVSGVGPRGEMLVETPPPGTFGGTLELVTRDGTRTDLVAAVPDQGFSRGWFGKAVGGRDAALFSKFTGVGYGSMLIHYVWSGGAVATLPVQSGFLFGQACLSRVLADGTVAYSGPDVAQQRYVVGIHHGGAPGTETELPVPAGVGAQLPCATSTAVPDALDGDGSVIGGLSSGEGALWRGGVLTRIPPAAGETFVEPAAVASGGRVVIRVTSADGAQRWYLWRDGSRRELTVPDGWTVRDIVELTATGLLVGNVTREDRSVRPIVWRGVF
jgi:hypothetical protein